MKSLLNFLFASLFLLSCVVEPDNGNIGNIPFHKFECTQQHYDTLIDYLERYKGKTEDSVVLY